MTEEIIIAGFGGQGVLSMGKMLVYAGMEQGLEVSWMPSYGPEIRGGTANVTVILSDRRISSPILQKYDTAIILNEQSLDKFESQIKVGGTLFYNPSTINRKPVRTDINVYAIDATNEAAKIGSSKTVNMFFLGAFIKVKPILTLDTLMRGLDHSISERNKRFMPLNEQAIKVGMELV